MSPERSCNGKLGCRIQLILDDEVPLREDLQLRNAARIG